MGVKPKKVASTVHGSDAINAAASGLLASFMAVPALTTPLSLKEMTVTARNENAAEASREGM